MANYLKCREVIESISKKIELKKALRLAKKNKNQEQVAQISSRLEKIDNKLQSTPLSKT